MKKIIIIWLAAVLLGTGSDALAQREIYTHPDFDKLISDHKTIAIIPFKVVLKLRPKEMEKMTEEEFIRLQVDEGIAVQSALHTYYLKRKEQGKANPNISMQPTAITNARLKQNGVMYENYDEFTPSQLCEILGVDAIVHGTMSASKPMSSGASLAFGAVTGFYGATNSGTISLQISEGATNELLWKYDKTLSRSLGSDTNTVINNLMKKASKKWPYDTE